MHSRDLRQMHASEIFYALLVEPGISQRELCNRTNCDKSTVSVIVRRFEELNVVARSHDGKSGQRGRPQERLSISGESGLLIGVHLEFDSLRFVASSLGGHLRSIHDATLPKQPERLGAAIEAGIIEFCAQLGCSMDDVQSIGVTVPGQIDGRGDLAYSPHLRWRNVDVGGQLAARIRGPFFLDNDTKAAALAERFFGMARQVDDFLLISGGLGIGGALFLDRDIYRGKNGFAGEIGHTKVVKDGRRCHCGADGCLAAYLSLPALFERASKLGATVAKLETLEARATAGERPIVGVLEESGELLGIAAANLVNLFNPPIVIVSGTIARLWPFLEGGFTRSLLTNSLDAPLAQTEIRVSQLGFDQFPKGGVAVALHGLTNLGSPSSF